MRLQSTKINMIAALVALAVVSWAAGAWAQNRSGRMESGNNAQQRGQGIASAVSTANAVSDKLPAVERLSRHGVIFTDWYSRQSCTSGRAAFETGRYPARAGLAKTGIIDPK